MKIEAVLSGNIIISADASGEDSLIIIHRGSAIRVRQQDGNLKQENAGKPLGLILPERTKRNVKK
jgi:hypothetical protein